MSSCSSIPGSLPAQTSALSAASQTIRQGQQGVDRAAANIAGDLNSHGTTSKSDLIGDIVDLSQSALQVKIGVAVARTDQEASSEIVKMVRHDADAQHARDTRPQPPRTLSQSTIDILV